ncbi:putative cytochrome c oxidase assembly protein COX15-like [Capsicum annuum]|nr:putative cytochrome c oxidase assembly protein COX15-like [Capsicum annuum]
MAASSDYTIENMYDVALKPRLLRSLLKEYVPDLKHQFRNPPVLSYVVSAIKTHQLLSESASLESDEKLIENWTATVDSWVNRVVALASSDTPDKCWAGISLLGVTCQECSRERFLASYSAWFNKLLLHLQSPEDSHFVKVATCASLSDLFTRLNGLPNAKKDGISFSSKLIQPLLKQLNEDKFDAVWEEAVFLLCTILDIFPSSIQRHYDGVEDAIVLRLISGKCSPSMLEKLGYCLALLPKSRGDEDSWLLMMQKIMLSINNLLNDSFQGLEKETIRTEAMRLLLPPGKDPPPPLGGQSLSRETADNKMRPEHLQISRISTLIFCCCKLLTSSYPFQVAIHVLPLIALTKRVLMVDGSSSPGIAYMTTMKQEFLCSELPVLHSHTLDLLSSIVKGLGSQLLPHVGSIIRLLTNYFETSTLPELRIKVYTIMNVLLMSLGVGISAHLTDVIVNNSLIDLDERGTSSVAQQKIYPETTAKTSHKKRKHASTSSSLEEQPDSDVFEVEMCPTVGSLSVKIAALEALEALLAVGGSWRSESWRVNVDHLLLVVTRNASKGGWAKDGRSKLVSEPTTMWGNYQIAALRALLASLLSPGRTRPPHLSQGLEVFRRGSREIGTKVAECCAYALLALEVLIHPRALPFLDVQSTDNKYEVGNKWFSGISDRAANITFHIGTSKKAPDESDSYNDDLYADWMRNSEDSDTVAADHGNDTDKSNQPQATLGDPSSEKLPSLDTTAVKDSKSSKLKEVAPNTVATKIPMDRDEVMAESQLSEETSKHSEEILPSKSETLASISSGKSSFQSSSLVSDGNALNPTGSEVQAEKLVLGAKNNVVSLGSEKFVDSASRKEVAEASDAGFASSLMMNVDRGKELMHESDNESMESIPDIVDVEPDSD